MRALLLALLCLVFTSLNDFIFKLFGRKKSALGGFVCVVGVICLISSLLCKPDLSNFGVTFTWGMIVGFFSVTANILLIRSMASLPVGIASTMYRLNMVPVIIGGWLLFGEQLTRMHVMGILAALIAIFCFLPKQDSSTSKSSLMLIGFCQAAVAMLLRAGLGLSTKMGINHGADETGIVLWTAVCWILGGPIWYLLAERTQKETFISKRTLGYGISSGIMVYMILWCTANMLATGNLSVTLPLAQMSFVLTFLLGLFGLKEKIDWKKAAGAAFGVLAVIILAMCSNR